MRCILCEKEIMQKNDEHVFPDAIGGKMKVHSICKDCNSKLGDYVDYPLTEDEYVLKLRSDFNIQNRNGKRVNLLEKLKFFDNNDGTPLIIQNITIKGETKLARHYPEKSKDINVDMDTMKVEYSSTNIDTVINTVEKACKKNSVFCDLEKLRRKIENESNVEKTFSKCSATVHFNMSNYTACIIKIIHEYLYEEFGDVYARSQLYEELKKILTI